LTLIPNFLVATSWLWPLIALLLLSGRTWKTFLHNHAPEVWACDFFRVPELFFRPLFAFFHIELQSRKVMHVNVTRSPTDPWVAQQLREATPYGQTPT
jgi:putative transposase